jgi:hypothetical protein
VIMKPNRSIATEASRAQRRRLGAGAIAGLFFSPWMLAGCASSGYREQDFKLGSAVSRNLFVDSSQFGNRRVKVRLRNSSGDPGVDMARIRGDVESGLRAAGFQIAEEDFGIVVDANLYFMNSVALGRQRASNELGVLLGGVAGYELAKGAGGIGAGSGAVLGAIAGATLQDVLRSHSDYNSYLAVCDVNIGVVRQQSTRRDSFVIGGNRFERDREQPDPTFEAFAQRETVKVYVYAGDRRERRDQVMWAIQERLARVVSNMI